MTAFSRDKGRRVEREVAKALHALTGIRFPRNLEQVRAEQLDDLTPSDPAWPFSIEVKARATGTGCAPAWIAQAVKAANKAGRIPCVAYKYDRRDVRVHVPVAAIAEASGGAWADCQDWADITLEGLAYVARELMARRALAGLPIQEAAE